MEGLYYGIDINSRTTIVSYYQPAMADPNTISMVMGSDEYQIPTALAKKNGMAQWYYGRDAKMQAAAGSATEVPFLLENALQNKIVTLEGRLYSARDLLSVYLKHLLELTGIPFKRQTVKKLVVTSEHLSMEMVEMMSIVAGKLGISNDQLLLIDHRESFYYYALNQKNELFLHDVMLFEATGDKILSCRLQRDDSTRPQTIHFLEHIYEMHMESRDQEFTTVCKDLIEEDVVSCVYLVGDGFDGNWMKESLAYLVKGRHVFIGKTLYSKGACFSGLIRNKEKEWPFVYIGDNEMKFNLSLKVNDRNEVKFITLITAGESWFNTKGECEVILDGSPEVELWIQKPESRRAKVDLLQLTDLPERENRTTRLRISAVPVSDQEIRVTIRDMGFGEIEASSGKSWTHTVSAEDGIDG
ncbi:MAG: DUF5716 family protein [Lachnospiraceae bacterium]|nr:DUF5716 family protein [Lachnospiraceae bacterium]